MSKDELWMPVQEIARRYGEQEATVRRTLTSRLPKDRNVKRGGRGRGGTQYRVDYVEENFGELPAAPETRVGKNASCIFATLESRTKDSAKFAELVSEMIQSDDKLRIRCVTGTDLFDPDPPAGRLMLDRVANKLETKILLLYPFGRSGRARCEAEGYTNLERNRLVSDSQRTFEFISEFGDDKLDVRWVDDTLHSFLILGDQGALVEPYDFGAAPNRRKGFGCIARSSPLFFIRKDSEYYEIVKSGFDYLFDTEPVSVGANGKPQDSDSGTLRTYTLEAMAREFESR